MKRTVQKTGVEREWAKNKTKNMESKHMQKNSKVWKCFTAL